MSARPHPNQKKEKHCNIGTLCYQKKVSGYRIRQVNEELPGDAITNFADLRYSLNPKP